MIAKICRGVDLEMLDKAIAQFEKDNFPYCDKNRYNYIIMSKETYNSLKKLCNYSLSCCSKVTGEIISYEGNRIAIDDGIPYGEVEIR